MPLVLFKFVKLRVTQNSRFCYNWRALWCVWDSDRRVPRRPRACSAVKTRARQSDSFTGDSSCSRGVRAKKPPRRESQPRETPTTTTATARTSRPTESQHRRRFRRVCIFFFIFFFFLLTSVYSFVREYAMGLVASWYAAGGYLVPGSIAARRTFSLCAIF